MPCGGPNTCLKGGLTVSRYPAEAVRSATARRNALGRQDFWPCVSVDLAGSGALSAAPKHLLKGIARAQDRPHSLRWMSVTPNTQSATTAATSLYVECFPLRASRGGVGVEAALVGWHSYVVSTRQMPRRLLRRRGLNSSDLSVGGRKDRLSRRQSSLCRSFLTFPTESTINLSGHYTVDRQMPQHSSTESQLRHSPQTPSAESRSDQSDSWEGLSREEILARRRSPRLAERLAKPAYVNTDACCRNGQAGLAYESARLGRRTELVICSDVTLAEHLALLMAMHDADSRLPDNVVFRVDSTAVFQALRHGHPDLVDAKRQIDELLRRHKSWRLVLVDRGRNKQAQSLAKRSLCDDH